MLDVSCNSPARLANTLRMNLQRAQRAHPHPWMQAVVGTHRFAVGSGRSKKEAKHAAALQACAALGITTELLPPGELPPAALALLTASQTSDGSDDEGSTGGQGEPEVDQEAEKEEPPNVEELTAADPLYSALQQAFGALLSCRLWPSGPSQAR